MSGPDTFPAPAPAPPATTVPLSTFNGTDPNGTWNLWVVDDTPHDPGTSPGQFPSGWTLEVITTETTTTTVDTGGTTTTTLDTGTTTSTTAATTTTTVAGGTTSVRITTVTLARTGYGVQAMVVLATGLVLLGYLFFTSASAPAFTSPRCRHRW